MNVIVINSPLVQLNSPYPSGAYLSSFFKSEGCSVRWFDLSNSLFRAIFCKKGLERLFELSGENAIKMAERAERDGDEATAFNIKRYVSCAPQWIDWIDFIVGMLCSGRSDFSEREVCHKFLFSPFAPRGNRMEVFLGGLGREATVDDVRFLCSYALADLADYITAVFDPDFSLIRYAEALTVDESSFEQIEKRLDSPVLREFFLPVLEEIFADDASAAGGGKDSDCKKCAGSGGGLPFSDGEKTLVCISAPFAGTFVPSLYAARYLKERFGDKVYIASGGGFVNTELRGASEKALGKYFDALSFDRGYGSYKNLFDEGVLGDSNCGAGGKTCGAIYKLRQFVRKSDGCFDVIEPLWTSEKYQAYEEEKTVSVVPDYSDIDFSLYPRVCDDVNAMHRLWNDGSWIKAYLAHGCYWHKCAFCDVNLDYVCGYKPVHVENLYERLLKTARQKGVYGIHLVDEALPPRIVKDFALCNARNGSPLYFWGNVRFEKSFSKDLAALLSYCGFGGVSAGIEAATGNGLENINKGTDIQSIVNACAAFKEAGILVHAYMIYGFWNDTPQQIIDSMETLRQFFENGLLDSAFWHKFVLTKNSRVFDEWEKGLHKELKPILPKKTASIFAGNNLHFEGERSFEKFGLPLENALASWMHGQKLGMKVQKWFDFAVPSPTVKNDFIQNCIEKYEAQNESRTNKFFNANLQGENGGGKNTVASDALKKDFIENVFWLGSRPVVCANRIFWNYLQEEECLDAAEVRSIFGGKDGGKRNDEKGRTAGIALYELSEFLWKLRPGESMAEREGAVDKLWALLGNVEKVNKLMRKLHYRGIVHI